MSRAPVLRFLGAAGTVTGSKFLIDAGQSQVLVDCGVFQGVKELRLLNWAPLPIRAGAIDAVVLSHAHLDHVGYLPALARQGFRGPMFATRATAELAAIVLADSARLQEEEAAYANRKGFSKHRPALPLYTEKDAELALSQIREVGFGESIEIASGIEVVLHPAGHILGSATVTVSLPWNRRTLLFSGDLGRPDHPILAPPDTPDPADIVIVESTYGDRTHEDESTELAQLAKGISDTAQQGGVVVIPAFAVDRTEVLLLALGRFVQEGLIPSLPIFVDSPMALAVLAIYRRAIATRDLEVRSREWPPDPFSMAGHLHEMHTSEQSKSINAVQGPAIIVSASGMATGGRVLHHLASRLPDARNLVVLAGYQAAGTRGRSLAEGVDTVKMLGRYVPVRARILETGAFSAHADSNELVSWLARMEVPPEVTYIVHGEPDASEALRRRVFSELGWPAVVPHLNETVRLDRMK